MALDRGKGSITQDFHGALCLSPALAIEAVCMWLLVSSVCPADEKTQIFFSLLVCHTRSWGLVLS